MLDVDIELLDAAELKVDILGLNCSREGGGSRRCGENLEAVRDVKCIWFLTKGRGARGSLKGAAATKGEEIGFGIVGRVLPQALSSLIPRRIVINGIATANGSFVASAGLPGHANARLERSFVPLYAGILVGTLACDEECAGGRVEIRLAVLDLGDRGGEIPSQA